MSLDSSLFSFFFFKQKTAYEMRISDWSSDVCSSDLLRQRLQGPGRAAVTLQKLAEHHRPDVLRADQAQPVQPLAIAQRFSFAIAHRLKIVVGGDGGKGDWWRGAPLVPPLRPSCSASEPGIDRKSTRLNSSHSCASRMP